MKKIIMSLGTLLFATAVVAGGTGAFFSDTETSPGNVFTAGAIDLQIDHTMATYNGFDCVSTCDPWAVAVEDFSQGQRKNGTDVVPGRSNPADALGPAQTSGAQNDPSPTGFVSLGFGGSITLHFPNGIDDGPGDDIRIYEATGGSNYPAESVLVEVSPDGLDWTTIIVTPNEITYDGTVAIDLNGVPIARYVRITDTTDPNDHPDGNADGYDLDAVQAIHCEDEELDGYVYDIWQCELWSQRDLTTETFFNFSDIKPQDSGSNLVSLHVDDNDAFLCLYVDEVEDAENDNLNPEIAAGDATSPEGELGSYLQVQGWYSDEFGNESSLAFGPTVIADLDGVAYADSDTTQPAIPGDTTEYLKLEWCLGEFLGDGSCDGDFPILNQTQTDSFLADVRFYAVQSRNNPDFQCEAVDIP